MTMAARAARATRTARAALCCVSFPLYVFIFGVLISWEDEVEFEKGGTGAKAVNIRSLWQSQFEAYIFGHARAFARVRIYYDFE